jgi:general secretion pathway protein D
LGVAGKNLRDLLRETDKILPEGSSETVVENTETASSSGQGVKPDLGTQGGGKPLRNRSTAGRPSMPIGPGAMQSNTTTTVHKSTFREAASVIANRETGVSPSAPRRVSMRRSVSSSTG